jgi:hypothetical protein
MVKKLDNNLGRIELREESQRVAGSGKVWLARRGTRTGIAQWRALVDFAGSSLSFQKLIEL